MIDEDTRILAANIFAQAVARRLTSGGFDRETAKDYATQALQFAEDFKTAIRESPSASAGS